MKKNQLIIAVFLFISSFLLLVLAGLMKLEHWNTFYMYMLLYSGIAQYFISLFYIYINVKRQKHRLD
jgi:uncharacterized membrane protein YesL